MDDDPEELTRRARMRALGYSEQPFYRGEATGQQPESYRSAFFSRNKETAAGFAARGGASGPREFRLNLQKTFVDHGPLNAERFASLVKSAWKSGDKQLALSLIDSVAPGKTMPWMVGFAKAQPNFVVAESGGAALIRQAIERGSRNSTGVFRAAGFDAIDTGRDVLKLSGEGIRLREAEFDPARAKSRNIRAGYLGPLLAGGLAYDAATSAAEAAEMTPNERRTRGLVAGGTAGGVTAGVPYALEKAAPAMARTMLGRAALKALPIAGGALGAFERGQQEAQPGSWFTTSSGYMWPNISLTGGR